MQLKHKDSFEKSVDSLSNGPCEGLKCGGGKTTDVVPENFEKTADENFRSFRVCALRFP